MKRLLAVAAGGMLMVSMVAAVHAAPADRAAAPAQGQLKKKEAARVK